MSSFILGHSRIYRDVKNPYHSLCHPPPIPLGPILTSGTPAILSAPADPTSELSLPLTIFTMALNAYGLLVPIKRHHLPILPLIFTFTTQVLPIHQPPAQQSHNPYIHHYAILTTCLSTTTHQHIIIGQHQCLCHQ
jgi:hypothetical protein